MRLVLTRSGGYGIYSVICHDGRYYALTGALGGVALLVRAHDLTGERVWSFRGHCGSSRYANFHLIPGRGLCVSFETNRAVSLETGDEFPLVTDESGAAVEQPDRNHHGEWRVWWAKRDQHITGTHDYRVASTDTHVFMTGSGAKAFGDIAMGPTQFAKVKAVKGLGHGKVVSYRRGGEARVMRLPDSKHNPIHIVPHTDGLTFLAVCRQAIYQIDADIE